MEYILELKNVSFAYSKTTGALLKNLSLGLGQKDRLGIIGDNGSGKSTLFNLCTGLLPLQTGEIFLDGKPLHTEKDFQWARPRMGYLLQRTEDQLFCPSVLEDVAFGPLNLGAGPAQAKEIALQTLQSLKLEHLADKAGCNLSGGEQKMAALATILSMKPKLLLLDEPSNDLDKNNIAKMKEILLEQNIPYIIVSHDFEFLQSTTTQCFCLDEGELCNCKK